MTLPEAKRQVIKYYARAYEDKLMAGTSGNASIFIREKGVMVITPSGVDYRELNERNMAVIDLDGNIKESGAVPSSEWQMHAEIYKKTDAVSVLHTHSQFATAFAVCKKPIPNILIEMAIFTGGEISVCDFAPAGSKELAEKVGDFMKTKPVCLMQNHGVCALGKSMEEAYVRATYVEDAAKIYINAKQIGEPLILK